MASKSKTIGIVAWSLVVVLLIGVVALAFLNKTQAGRAAGLSDALLQVGTTAGVTNLALELLQDATQLPDLLQQMQTAIQGVQQELVSTKDALTAAQTEASGAKAEAATLSQSVKDQTAQVETLTKDQTAKEEALAAAKAAAEKAGQELAAAQAAQQAADQQKGEMEGSIENLKAQMAEESSKLQAELEAARQQVQALEAAKASPSPAKEKAADEEMLSATQAEAAAGRIIGQSQMFVLIRYSEKSQTLFLRLRDGQTMTYKGVPPDVYNRLINAADRLDMNYRFKIEGAFTSIPPDSIVVRKFWKWQRRHPGSDDVRVIEPEAMPVVEVNTAPAEAPVVEAAVEEVPAEAPVVEAAVEAAPVEAPAAEVAVEAAPVEAPAAEVAVEAVPAEAPVVEAAPVGP